MAAEGQNFAIFDLDEFTLRFNVTDAEANINPGSAEAWWGVSDSDVSTVTQYSDLKMQKSTGGWGGNSGVTAIPTTIGGLDINALSIDCASRLSNGSPGGYYTGSINLQPDSWGSDTSVEYYHELIWDDLGEQKGSIVLATGTLTVHRSAFTELGYRA